MKTACYLQVKPEFGGFSYNKDTLCSVSVKRVTQQRPETPIPGSVVVKINLDIADAAFLPLAPEATVVIPAEHAEAVVVTSEPVLAAE